MIITSQTVRTMLEHAAAAGDEWSRQMVDRFPATAWCCPLVCSGRSTHADELLGLVHNEGNGNGPTWSPRVIHTSDGSVEILVHFTRLWATDDTTEAERDALDELRGRGTWLITCPECATSPRRSEAEWWKIIEHLGISDTQRFDVSQL